MTSSFAANVVLATFASALLWLGYATTPLSGLSLNLQFALCVASSVPIILMLLLRENSSQRKISRLVLCLAPVLSTSLIVVDGSPQVIEAIQRFAIWPYTSACIVGAIFLWGDQGTELDSLALFALGAAVSSVLALAAASSSPLLTRYVFSTVFHFSIVLMFLSLLIAMVDAALFGLSQKRERLLRSLTGLLPLLGFLGTVAGIMQALGALPRIFRESGVVPEELESMMLGLSVAFETTLIGLVCAAVCSLGLTLLIDQRETKV